MTEKQEKNLRSVSKFLRTIFSEDIDACAIILNAEANILTGDNVNESISTLIEALGAVRQKSCEMITKLKAQKGE